MPAKEIAVIPNAVRDLRLFFLTFHSRGFSGWTYLGKNMAVVKASGFVFRTRASYFSPPW